MDDYDGLRALEALHRDLDALREDRLPIVERLWIRLDERIQEFKDLLDHKPKSEASRNTLSTGNVEFNNVKYSLNDDFKNAAIQIADELDLDELEAAKLFLFAQKDALDLDRAPVVSAIIRFHRRRQYLLECIRLLLFLSFEGELEVEEHRLRIESVCNEFLGISDTNAAAASKYWQKSFATLKKLEEGLQKVADRSQLASVVTESYSPESRQILEFERVALSSQHEALATIATYLVDRGRAFPQDFDALFNMLRTVERYDIVMLHYIPIILAFASQFGSVRGSCTVEEAQNLHKTIISDRDTDKWSFRRLYHLILCSWIVEYKGRFPDISPTQSGEPNSDDLILSKALKEGGLQFMLSIVNDLNRNDWYDPARAGLTEFLLRDTASLPSETPKSEENFRKVAMTGFQSFIDAFISNMPDTLRLLRYEEDDQRKLLRSRFQRNTQEYQYHLETFLVLIAFAYQNDPDSAEDFWAEKDGNLYGFLQWAAKRQTTPRASAFCEMLRSLSQGPKNSEAAHKFLLSEGPPIPGKLRRTASLSWNQVFAELEFYSSSIKDKPAPIHLGSGPAAPQGDDQILEPESTIMLECYLRLISHLCSSSLEARNFVLNHENPSLPVILFQLAGSNIESRLRGCSFIALASFLTEKTNEIGESMWLMLDQWISGGISVATMIPRPATVHASSWPEQVIFNLIDTDFEEPNAFIRLLTGLISPCSSDAGLNDALPFPENLGTASHFAGIDNFVDFAVGRVFGQRTLQVSDPIQQRMLRLNCLDLICTCLSTFNEDLVVIANKSSVPVEAFMKCSSLEAYVRLHPFARVMEWMYDDKALQALVAAGKQDVDEVNNADGGSPLVLSLVRSVEVMNLILKYQPTYLNIIRPLLKSKLPNRKPVSRSILPTFEDAVLKNLDMLINLGLYCGLGHADLTIASLNLLEKLASSPRLTAPASGSLVREANRNRLIAVFERNEDAERISRALVSALALDPWELEAGPVSPGYIIKAAILSFLRNCLLASPNRPSIAHLLLGFKCAGNEISVMNDSLFSRGCSLFHSISKLSLEYPDEDGTSYIPWLSNIREACSDIFSRLWRSPLSCALVMTDLRSSEYIFLMAMRQRPIGVNTLWDGKLIMDYEFLLTDSAIAYRNFLCQRAAFYEYLARELRITVQEEMTGIRKRLQALVLGTTQLPGADPVPSPTIFDLFDFAELEMPPLIDEPPLKYLDLDYSVCKTEVSTDCSNPEYDLARVEELMLLRQNELETQYPRPTPGSRDPKPKHDLNWDEFDEERRQALLYILGANQKQDLDHVMQETLKAWTTLMLVVLRSCKFDTDVRELFVEQAIHLILPKFERACGSDHHAAVELANVLNPLVDMSTLKPPNLGDSKAIDFGNDKMFNVFRAALNGICHESNVALREICYQICYKYLCKCMTSSDIISRRKHILRNIKPISDRLIGIVCDDAYSSQGTCRQSALLLLDCLVLLCARENSKMMLIEFARSNFVGVLVDNIKQIPLDLSHTEPSKIPALLNYYNACLALILRVAQTRDGATLVLNSGLFQCVRDSQIFAADPDVGLDVENPEALKKFFDLMLSVLRIINSVVLSRGTQHDQTIKLAREFLRDNRHSMVAVFKRHASIGGIQVDGKIDLADLVDNYTVLVSATEFIQFEEQETTKRSPLGVFS